MAGVIHFTCTCKSIRIASQPLGDDPNYKGAEYIFVLKVMLENNEHFTNKKGSIFILSTQI